MLAARTLVAVLIAASVLALPNCHAADWPGWRGPTTDMVAPDSEVFESSREYELALTKLCRDIITHLFLCRAG